MPKPPNPSQPPSYYDYRNSPEVKTYLIPSILVTLGCCVPLGIAAIYYAAQVKSHLASGNYNSAVKASDNAKFFCWLSFGAGIFIAIFAYSLRK
ncbi:MAG: CD225/dispanin family protein [Planctomycetes bacterium]|nr:CD225/dispanin family protein [Planctomycetota bacterium]